MISIIICSINTDYLLQIKENISNFIGVEYELLIWDNKNNDKSLCEAYNLLAETSTFDYLCFIHEDILIETTSWGKKIISIFAERPDIGVLGLAGSKYKSGFFSGWYTSIKEFDCANLVHRYDNGEELIYLKPVDGSLLEEVVCLDGVFMCCRKDIWKRTKFNQAYLKGFHFYDIDFSLSAAKITKVAVTYEISLIHITTGGDFSNGWVTTAMEYHAIKRNELPYSKLASLPPRVDKIIVKAWLDVLKSYNISWSNRLRWLIRQNLFLQPFLIYSILKFLFYHPLRLKYIHELVKSK